MISDDQWRSVQGELGIVPDHDIATKLGCSVQAVYQRRKSLGIPAAVPRTNDPGLPAGHVRKVLATIEAYIGRDDRPYYISLRAAGKFLKRSPRSIQKWFNGDNAINASDLRKLQVWMRMMQTRERMVAGVGTTCSDEDEEITL